MVSISDWLTVQVQDPQLCRAHCVCCTHWPLCPRMILRSFPKQRRTHNYSCLFIHFTLPVQLVDVRHLGTCLLWNFLSRWGEQTSMQIPRHWWAWKIPQGRGQLVEGDVLPSVWRVCNCCLEQAERSCDRREGWAESLQPEGEQMCAAGQVACSPLGDWEADRERGRRGGNGPN